MTEVSFIRNNLEKWGRMEKVCEKPSACAPDELASAYEELVADLAFAQTHYPEAQITDYLNDLALAIHVRLYRRRPGAWRHVWDFLRRDVPLAMYEGRRCLLASLVVFLAGVIIGVISQLGDSDFAYVILGGEYVEMTLDNIKNGQPMAVYSMVGGPDSFLSITWNNVGVAMMAFSSGLLTLCGTGMVILYNSVMLGTFQTFFFQQGVGMESVLAIWLHGTLEIGSIIVSGGAGLMLGTGWLFPGTLKRKDAFRLSARQALRIVMGTVPIFIVAGFFEGFFTRHTEWSDGLRFSIIFLSASFLYYYIIWLPGHLASKYKQVQTRK